MINLASRSDRWDSVVSQLASLGMEIVRIDAQPISNISAKKVPYVTPGVAATWQSHQLAMKTFLESGEDYGLILEDDFLLRKSYQDILRKFEKLPKYDFIQLGYLKTSPFDAIGCYISNLTDLSLKFLALIFHLGIPGTGLLSTKLLVREQLGIPTWLVRNDIRAGAHAYIVSRRFAKAALEMNKPVFICTDGYFMSLGGMRTFSMFRLRNSVIRQSKSPSSVTSRFTAHD